MATHETPRDPYAVLGVPRSSTTEEIRRAYHALANEHHPDRHDNSPASNQKMRTLTSAYDALKDDAARAETDRHLPPEAPPAEPAPDAFDAGLRNLFHALGHRVGGETWASLPPKDQTQMIAGGVDLVDLLLEWAVRAATSQARAPTPALASTTVRRSKAHARPARQKAPRRKPSRRAVA